MAFHVQNIPKKKGGKGKFVFTSEMAWAIPFFLVLLLLVLFPFVFIFIDAFTNVTQDGYIYLTLNNFAEYFSSNEFLLATGRSLYFALIATIICLVIGYPVAYFIGRTKAKVRNILVLLLMIPMWINMLLRILAWKQIFTMVETWTGLELLGTDFAIIFGMVYDYLPFMIIPIYTSIMKIDTSYFEASRDLGANGLKTFNRITVPLSMPGIISGITMVFLPAATTLIIPDKLGGGNPRYFLIGNLIESYFIKQSNPYVGSAIALVLSLIILLMVFLINRLDRTVVKDEVPAKRKMKKGAAA